MCVDDDEVVLMMTMQHIQASRQGAARGGHAAGGPQTRTDKQTSFGPGLRTAQTRTDRRPTDRGPTFTPFNAHNKLLYLIKLLSLLYVIVLLPLEGEECRIGKNKNKKMFSNLLTSLPPILSPLST